ncbi:hypothetical protein CC117_15700 [Parafrankia colletiae]|uniref:Integral membrane protein n=1 Tax=Parafrankia colletiae TaxID=573497 RepID=A0A1S1R0Z0_9ACTN|nr:hypothetical protein CC117_15700 [Parafrankia colletiae]
MAGLPLVRGVRDTGRFARAAVFGVASVCLAVAAHVAAGGIGPSLPLVLVSSLLLVRIAFGLAGRERPLGTVATGVVATQVLLHTAFVLATHHGPATDPGHQASREVTGAGAHLLTELVPGPAMAGGHALAALCVAVALHRSERRLWAAAALREAVDRFVTVVAGLLMTMIDRLRAATRLALAAGPGTWTVACGAALAASSLGRVGGGRGGAHGGPGRRWITHLLLLGSEAGWRGPPGWRPGSSPRPAC